LFLIIQVGVLQDGLTKLKQLFRDHADLLSVVGELGQFPRSDRSKQMTTTEAKQNADQCDKSKTAVDKFI
jgi:hypothetical protein